MENWNEIIRRILRTPIFGLCRYLNRYLNDVKQTLVEINLYSPAVSFNIFKRNVDLYGISNLIVVDKRFFKIHSSQYQLLYTEERGGPRWKCNMRDDITFWVDSEMLKSLPELEVKLEIFDLIWQHFRTIDPEYTFPAPHGVLTHRMYSDTQTEYTVREARVLANYRHENNISPYGLYPALVEAVRAQEEQQSAQEEQQRAQDEQQRAQEDEQHHME